jgi:hypothetical protein
MQIVTDATGRIIAMCAAEDEPVARPTYPVHSGNAAQMAQAVPVLRARAGQVLHVLPLPAELAGLSLKEIHTTHRVVVQAGRARLERIAK